MMPAQAHLRLGPAEPKGPAQAKAAWSAQPCPALTQVTLGGTSARPGPHVLRQYC